MLALLILVAASCTRPDPTAPPRQLTLDATGDGVIEIDGVVLTLPYSQALRLAQPLRVEARPADGQRFVGWDGDLAGSGSVVRLRLWEDLSASARFEPVPTDRTLVLAYDGDGAGRVWSDPWGLDCQRPCAGSFATGDEVTLSALPDPDAYLVGWASCDALDGDSCRVRVDRDRTVWARFAPIDSDAPNDAFADRLPLTGAAGVVRATNARATSEPHEPSHGPAASGRSLWWSWTAPLTGGTRFDVRASGVPATVAVYRGESVTDLTRVPGDGADGTITFEAIAGETYQVAVDGVGGAAGFVRLAWSGTTEVAWQAAPSLLRLAGDRGADAPLPVDLVIGNDGSVTGRFETRSNVPWLRVEPPSGELAPGATRTLRVAADACDVSGVDVATLTVVGGGTSAAVTVERSCRGAAWRASPAALAIVGAGDGAPTEARLTLANDGDAAPLSVASDAAWLLVEPASARLERGEQLVLDVRAAPCAGAGVRGAALLVSGGGHELRVPVTLRCGVEGASLTIERVHVNQAVPTADTAQDASVRIPIVAGRSGLLRVFVRADAAGVEDAVATLRYRTPGAGERTLQLRGPSLVPLVTDEGSLELDYQALLPGDVLQPGFEASVELRAVHDGETLWARFPPTGSWRPEVEVTDPAPVTLVPISLNGGPVPIMGDPEAYLDLTRRTFPLADDAIDVQVRSPVAFNGDLTTRQAWSRMLRRLIDVHASDGVARHYVGLVSPPPSGLFGGIARTGQPREGGFTPVVISTASLTLGPWVVAHELGHMWGRRHAPCGTPDADPAFPYPDGGIGVWGFDAVEGRLRHPEDSPDLMGYCRVDAWISDHTFAGVLAFRRSFGRLPEPAAEARRVAVVSGEVSHTGAVTLDPLFELERLVTAGHGGPYRAVVWDETGRTLAEARFDTFDTSLHDAEQFHVTLPLPAGAGSVAGVRIEREGVVLSERSASVRPLRTATPPSAVWASDGSVLVRWDTTVHQELLVLEGATGVILGSDLSGALRVWPRGDGLVAVLSDGVRSERFPLAP